MESILRRDMKMLLMEYALGIFGDGKKKHICDRECLSDQKKE